MASAKSWMPEGSPILAESPDSHATSSGHTTSSSQGQTRRHERDKSYRKETKGRQKIVAGVKKPSSPRRRPRAGRRGVPCTQCKEKKRKCVGQPPACEACIKQGSTCSLSDSDGLIVQRNLAQAFSHREPQWDDLVTLVSWLREGSDPDATMLLAQLRLGASVKDLAQIIREGLVQHPSTFALTMCVEVASVARFRP